MTRPPVSLDIKMSLVKSSFYFFTIIFSISSLKLARLPPHPLPFPPDDVGSHRRSSTPSPYIGSCKGAQRNPFPYMGSHRRNPFPYVGLHRRNLFPYIDSKEPLSLYGFIQKKSLSLYRFQGTFPYMGSQRRNPFPCRFTQKEPLSLYGFTQKKSLSLYRFQGTPFLIWVHTEEIPFLI